MYTDLHSFITALDKQGELRRIGVPVSPVLEIAEITDRVSKSDAPSHPSDSAKANDPRCWRLGGPALLFEDVAGSDFPVLINAYGSYRRMELALGCSRTAVGLNDPGRFRGGFDGMGKVIGELVEPKPPKSWRAAIGMARRYAPLLRIAPKLVKQGMCQEVVKTGDAVDLTRLPLLRCWPADGAPEMVGYPAGVNDDIPGFGHPGMTTEHWEAEQRGRFVTLAGVHTIHADDAGVEKPSSHNIGMYRMQLVGKNRLIMHWHVHHDGAAHWRSWKARGEPMPVAIAFGGESVMPYAATAPLPPGISELLLAGFMMGKGIPMVAAKTVPLRVPANAEIVIEGFVRHDAGTIGWEPGDEPLGPGAAFEGPFGDHTGFYSMPDRYPIFEVTAITHRTGAVFPATIVGQPPQEDYYIGKATERVFLPLLKTLVPDIEDYDLPMFGAFHNAVCVKIDKVYPLQARRIAHAVWGAGQMAWTKNVFVVDNGVDVHDALAVLKAAAVWCRPDRDIERVRGPLDILDHAAPRLGAGTKLGFDCTKRWSGEEAGGLNDLAPRDLLEGNQRDRLIDSVKEIAGVRDASLPDELGGWLLVRCAQDGRSEIARQIVTDAWRIACAAPPPYMIVVGASVDLRDIDSVLFHWCSCCDAGRDAMWGAGRVAFDATPKTTGEIIDGDPVRAWPPILEMDDATKRLVTDRWTEYGLE